MYLGIKWLLPGRILYGAFSGLYTLDDVSLMLDDAAQRITESGEPPYTHIILDGTAVSELEKNMLKLIQVAQVTQAATQQKRVGWIITVDPDPHPVLYFVGSAVMQVTGMRFRHLKSMDLVSAFLNDVDSTLPALPRWTQDELALTPTSSP